MARPRSPSMTRFAVSARRTSDYPIEARPSTTSLSLVALGVLIPILTRYTVGSTTLTVGLLTVTAIAWTVGFRSLQRTVTAVSRDAPLLLFFAFLVVFLPVFATAADSSLTVTSQAGLLALPLAWLGCLTSGYKDYEGDRFALNPVLLGALLTNSIMVISQLSSANSLLSEWDAQTKIAVGGLGFGRPTGAFLNPNELGGFGLVLFCVGLPSRGRWSTLFLTSGLALALLSGSRGYLLGLLCVWFFWILRSSQGKLRRFAVLSATAVVALLVVPNAVASRVGSAFGGSDASVQGRLTQLSETQLLSGRFVLGTGRPPLQVIGGSLDSDLAYLTILWGLPALLLLVVSVFRIAHRLDSPGPPSALSLLAIGLLISGTAQLGAVGLPGLALFYLVGNGLAALARRSTLATKSTITRPPHRSAQSKIPRTF